MKKRILVFIIILLLLIPSIVLAQDNSDELPKGVFFKMGIYGTGILLVPLPMYQPLIGISLNLSGVFNGIGIGIEYTISGGEYRSIGYAPIVFNKEITRLTIDIFYFTNSGMLSSFQPFIGYTYYRANSDEAHAHAYTIDIGYKHTWGKKVFFVYYSLFYAVIISHSGNILSGGFTETHLGGEAGIIFDITPIFRLLFK